MLERQARMTPSTGIRWAEVLRATALGLAVWVTAFLPLVGAGPVATTAALLGLGCALLEPWISPRRRVLSFSLVGAFALLDALGWAYAPDTIVLGAERGALCALAWGAWAVQSREQDIEPAAGATRIALARKNDPSRWSTASMGALVIATMLIGLRPSWCPDPWRRLFLSAAAGALCLTLARGAGTFLWRARSEPSGRARSIALCIAVTGFVLGARFLDAREDIPAVALLGLAGGAAIVSGQAWGRGQRRRV